MTNPKHPGDETSLKQELFAAWTAEHPDGTRQQFDDEWVAMTNETRPSIATNHTPSSWDDDPIVLKRRMFEEWRARRPDGTHEQFEAEWGAITSTRSA